MGRVARLDARVIDRIAAGEVVDRPASVVKELVENAIDAGATRILVELSGGGADRVRVTDDGSGMDRDDARLCVERHATSKIRSDADLVGVATLGFRGEALPSIASVSRFEIRTRRAEDAVGTRVAADGAAAWTIEDAGGPVGTSVTVDDLFFNVPARRKFLRTPGTELAHCQDVVQRTALTRPAIDLRVAHEGRELLRASTATSLQSRVAQLLREKGTGLRPVDLTVEGVRVHGLVGGPERSAPDPGNAWLFVNDRFVRDPVVRRGLAEGFDGLLPRGRHPVAVLSVVVDPAEVDVNVHPAKIEVRFRDPGAVTRALAAAIRSVFGARPSPGPLLAREPEAWRAPEPLPWRAPPRPALVAHPDDDPSFRERPAPNADTSWIPEPAREPLPDHPPQTPVGRPSTRHWRAIEPLALHDGWLVCGDGDGFWFVDLAAAARRVTLLGLGDLGERAPMSPIAVTVPPGRAVDLAARATSAGVPSEPVDGGRVAITAVPRAVPVDRERDLATLVFQALATRADTDAAVRDAVAEVAATVPDAPVGWLALLATLDERGVPLGLPLAARFPTDEVRRRLR